MKVKDVEGFDYDYLGNWEYLNKEIAIAIDEADMFTYLRNLYVIEGMKIITEKKSDSDFWDLYTSVADNVATEIQNGKHTGILEAVMSTDTFYKCIREYYTNDILYHSDDKHTISTVALKALSDALYELILHNNVSNYLNMELAKAIYKKWYGSTDNFPYAEVAECLKNSPAYTDVKIGEYVQNLKKIFPQKKITITVNVPNDFSTKGLQCILEKYFLGNIEITEN